MSRRRPPQWLIEQRKSASPRAKTKPDKSVALDLKFWAGMVVAAISLLLAVLGLWLAVEDRPTVSLGLPTDATNIFSTQITIVNNGVLPIHDVSFATFLKLIRFEDGSGAISSIGAEYEVPTRTLMPGEPVTTSFSTVIGPLGASSHFFGYKQSKCKTCEIALIASFRPTWAPFWLRTRAFRFKTIETSGGTILQQVPAEDIESEFRKALLGR